MKSSEAKWLIGGLIAAGLCFALMATGVLVLFRYVAKNPEFLSLGEALRDDTAIVDAPAQWRAWAERTRVEREQNQQLYDRLRDKYERVAPYVEVRRRVFHDSDFAFAQADLARQFSEISEPMAALNYSTTIGRISDFTYDTDPDELRIVMERWTDAYPDSHFAWLIRGRQAINYAWFWRGSGWSSTVSDEAWEQFRAAISEADEFLERAYRIEPNDPEIASGMITVCKAQRRPRREMEKYFERATQIVPAHLGAYAGKFDYLRPAWFGSWPEFKEVYDSLDKKIEEQGHPILRIAKRRALDTMESEWEDLGDGLTEQQRKENARRDWLDIRREMAGRWPEDVNVRGQYAYELHRADQYRAAREEFDWIGDRFPMECGWSIEKYHESRLNAYIYGSMRVRGEERFEWLQQALEIDADYYMTYHFLGILHRQNGELDQAIDAAYRATELDPTEGGPHMLIAALLEDQGHLDEALQEIRTALSLKLPANIRERAEETAARMEADLQSAQR